MTTVQDTTGKVFCILPDEPLLFDPFQIRSIREVTRQRAGSREEYTATQVAWIDGSWTDLNTSFDDVVEAVASAWERMHADI